MDDNISTEVPKEKKLTTDIINIAPPKDYRGSMDVTIIGEELWIDLFPSDLEEKVYTWHDGKWEDMSERSFEVGGEPAFLIKMTDKGAD